MSDECQRLVDLLQDFVGGELAPEIVATLCAHIESCPPCGNFVATYRQTIVITRTLPCQPIPTDIAERLLQALKRECGE